MAVFQTNTRDEGKVISGVDEFGTKRDVFVTSEGKLLVEVGTISGVKLAPNQVLKLDVPADGLPVQVTNW